MYLPKNNLQLLLIIDKTVTYFNGAIKYLICSHYLHGLNLNFGNAFGSLAMNEARIRIMTNGTMTPVFSTQDIVECSEYSQGLYKCKKQN
jgi:hypothetical protein